MHTKAWRTEHMGSEGWAVFMPNPKLPRFEIMIASNMSEEHARLIAEAPAMLEALEELLGVHYRLLEELPDAEVSFGLATIILNARNKATEAIRNTKGE